MNPRHSPHPMPKAVFVPLSVAKQKKKAELFCKERLWVYNYVMKTTKIIQKDYTSSILNYQFKLPLEMEVLIEDNDPVRLLSVFVEGLELSYGIRFIFNETKFGIRTLKKIRKRLYRIKDEEGIIFVHGCGKKQSRLQKDIKELETCLANQKTNDTQALIPFLQDMESHLSFRYRDIVADADYESEENYLFIEENGQTAYIKPGNYERSKKARYRNDIGRAENMTYDEEENSYVCHNGKKLEWRCDTERTSKTGYTRVTSIYECKECKGCPCKTDCIHGNHCKTPMEERRKTLHVQKTLNAKRKECVERITSDYGKQLRMNRSIQMEGSFADIKADMGFRRYTYRGMENILAQSIILAIAHNINKLHKKIQNGHTGQHLFELKKSA